MYDGKQYSFQVDSSIVQEIRHSRDNFLIQYDENCSTKEYCAIYFSSNDIYYPNSEYIFIKRIVEKDVYEWFGTRIKKAYKHIFIRDVYKQWYLKGINDKIDTPEKLSLWLKDETKGYKVITVGSSAGGYAALLYGSQLNAERILAFNPQFELFSLLDSSDEARNPLVHRFNDMEYSQYFDILPFLHHSQDNNYYFYSSKSHWDILQFEHIKNVRGIHCIGFNTSHHGIPFLKVALQKVLNMDKDSLQKLERGMNNPLLFTIKMVGLWKAIIGFYKQIVVVKMRRK